MKKLIKWLKMEERNQAWLARKLGITEAACSLAINRHQPFSLYNCEKIYNLTGGDVTLEDLRPDIAEFYPSYNCLKELFKERK